MATVLLVHELETGDPGTGKWAALNALWGQNLHVLSLHLLTALDALPADAHARFSLILPPLISHAPLGFLLASANELLRVLSHLIPSHPLPTRAVNGLVDATADLFACADGLGMPHHCRPCFVNPFVLNPSCDLLQFSYHLFMLVNPFHAVRVPSYPPMCGAIALTIPYPCIACARGVNTAHRDHHH